MMKSSIHVISLLASASTATASMAASDLPTPDHPTKLLRGYKIRNLNDHEPHVSELNDSSLVTNTILEGDNLVIQYEGHTDEQSNMVTVNGTMDNGVEDETEEDAKAEKHAKRQRAKKEHDERVKKEHVKKVHPKKERVKKEHIVVEVEEVSKKRHAHKKKSQKEEADIPVDSPEGIEIPYGIMSMPVEDTVEAEEEQHPKHKANRKKKLMERKKHPDIEFGISMPAQEEADDEHPKHKANRMKKNKGDHVKKQKKQRAEKGVVVDVVQRRGLKHYHNKKQRKHHDIVEIAGISMPLVGEAIEINTKKEHHIKRKKGQEEDETNVDIEVDGTPVVEGVDNDSAEEQRKKKADKFEHFKEQIDKVRPVKAERTHKGRGGPKGSGLVPMPAPSGEEVSITTETVSTVGGISIADESTVTAPPVAAPAVDDLLTPLPTDNTPEEGLEAATPADIIGIVADATTTVTFTSGSPTSPSATFYPTWSPTLSPTWLDDVEDVMVPTTVAASATTATTTEDATIIVEDIISAPTTTTAEEPPAATGLMECPPPYDPTKSNYAAGDLVEVLEHTFQCHFGEGIMSDLYVPYCNIHEWDDNLLEINPEAKVLWKDAWVNIGPCEAVLLEEVLADEIDGEER